MSLLHKIREGVWTGTAAMVVEYALKIPRMMVMTRFLSPELYGLLSLFGMFRTIVGQFVQFGSGDAVIKFLSSGKAGNEREQMSATMGAAGIIRTATMAVLLVATILFEDQIAIWLRTYPALAVLDRTELLWIIRLLLAGVAIQAAEGPLGNALQGFQAWRTLLVVRIVSALATTILPAAAVLLGFRLVGVVAAQQASFLVVAVMIFISYRRKVAPLLRRVRFAEAWRATPRVFRFGFPLVLSSFFQTLYNYTDQVMLTGMGKMAQELSYYSAGMSLASFIGVVPVLMRNVMFPAASEYGQTREIERLEALLRFMAKHFFWLLLPVAFWGAALSNEILLLISGAAYLPAAPVLGWLAVSRVLVGLGTAVFICLVGALGRTREQFFVSASVGLLNLGLNYLLISRHGYMGAVWATCICRVVGLTLGTYILSRYMRVRPPLRAMGVCLALSLPLSGGLYAAHLALGLFALPLVLPAALVYGYGIVRLGVFDSQDVEYLERVLGRFHSRIGGMLAFLRRNSAPVAAEYRV